MTYRYRGFHVLVGNSPGGGKRSLVRCWTTMQSGAGDTHVYTHYATTEIAAWAMVRGRIDRQISAEADEVLSASAAMARQAPTGEAADEKGTQP